MAFRVFPAFLSPSHSPSGRRRRPGLSLSGKVGGGTGDRVHGRRDGGPDILLAVLTDLSADHRAYKWARFLLDQGYRPCMLCDAPRQPLGKAWEGIPIRFLTRKNHMDGFLRAYVPFLLRLTLLLLRTRAKVWVSLDAPPLLALSALAKLRGATAVYDSHELFLKTPLVQGRATRRWFWTFWHDVGIRWLGAIISVSPGYLRALQAGRPRHRTFLLPNMPRRSGAEPGFEDKPSPVGETASLIFQGGLRIATGLHETFWAMAAMPGLRLDILGRGSEEAALRASAQKAGVENRVRFLGQVPFDAVAEKVAAAHIALNLMQPVNESFAQTWANKAFDAIHALTPVLLADTPGNRLLLEKFRVGEIVDGFSPAAIAAGLRKLLRDWEAYREQCLLAREVWHWDAYAAGLPAFLGLDAPRNPSGACGASLAREKADSP